MRGIRAFTDYEYELQMALTNRKLAPDLETVFLMPALAYTYVSSRLVREIFQLGGSVSRNGSGAGGRTASSEGLSGQDVRKQKLEARS